MSTAPLVPGKSCGMPEPASTPAPLGGGTSRAVSPPAGKGAVAADFASLLKADLSKDVPAKSVGNRTANSGQRDRRNTSSRLVSTSVKSALPGPNVLSVSPAPSPAPLHTMSAPLLFSPDDDAARAPSLDGHTESPPLRFGEVFLPSASENRGAPAVPGESAAISPSPRLGDARQTSSPDDLEAVQLPGAGLPPSPTVARTREASGGAKVDLPVLHPAPPPPASPAPDDSTPPQTTLGPGSVDGSLTSLPGGVSTVLDPPAMDAPRLAAVTANQTPAGGSARGPRGRAGSGPTDHSAAALPPPTLPPATRSGLVDPGYSAPSTIEVVGGGAKSMTTVMKPTPDVDGAFGGAGARLREALVSVANHAVIRSAAGGEIDVPELGRVVVRAHGLAGGVDVNVSAERAEARAVLHAHAGAIASDLREADVPLTRLTIDRAAAGHPSSGQSTHDSPFSSSGSSGDRKGSARDSARDPEGPSESADDASGIHHQAQGRVRIVL